MRITTANEHEEQCRARQDNTSKAEDIKQAERLEYVIRKVEKAISTATTHSVTVSFPETRPGKKREYDIDIENAVKEAAEEYRRAGFYVSVSESLYTEGTELELGLRPFFEGGDLNPLPPFIGTFTKGTHGIPDSPEPTTLAGYDSRAQERITRYIHDLISQRDGGLHGEALKATNTVLREDAVPLFARERVIGQRPNIQNAQVSYKGRIDAYRTTEGDNSDTEPDTITFDLYYQVASGPAQGQEVHRTLRYTSAEVLDFWLNYTED